MPIAIRPATSKMYLFFAIKLLIAKLKRLYYLKKNLLNLPN